MTHIPSSTVIRYVDNGNACATVIQRGTGAVASPAKVLAMQIRVGFSQKPAWVCANEDSPERPGCDVKK
jgi:hypothetical protein